MNLNKNEFNYWCDDILRGLDGYLHPEVGTNDADYTLQLDAPRMQAVMNALRWSIQNIEQYEAQPCHFCAELGVEMLTTIWLCKAHLGFLIEHMQPWTVIGALPLGSVPHKNTPDGPVPMTRKEIDADKDYWGDLID
jgi:hypothetical protein